MDIEVSDEPDLNLEQYWHVINLKTGPLISSILEAGAIVAGGSEEQRLALKNYGNKLALAWQLKDDLLDFIGNPETIGKPIFNDARERKRNFIFITSYCKPTDDEKEILKQLWGNQNITFTQISKTLDIIDKYQVKQILHDKLEQLTTDAISLLKILPETEAKDRLIKIADLVVHRMA